MRELDRLVHFGKNQDAAGSEIGSGERGLGKRDPATGCCRLKHQA